MTQSNIKVGFLHVAPINGNINHNVALLEKLFLQAAKRQADLVITSELAVSGYAFRDEIGVEWIKERVPEIINHFSRLAQTEECALILGTPTYSMETDSFHNTAVFIDHQGKILGSHHKINVLPVGSETWATRGSRVQAVSWMNHKIGLLICSDAYTDTISAQFSKQSTDVVISPAAWAPGEYGPDGEWEQRSLETELPYFVCNRTGQEPVMDFRESSTVVVINGKRVVEYNHSQPAVLMLDVDATNWRPLTNHFNVEVVCA